MKPLFIGALAALSLFAAAPVMAQQNNQAGFMWGTTSQPPGNLESAAAHRNNGEAAAQALAGRNLTTANIMNYAIGVQNNNSINGDGSTINSDQTGTNTGGIRADGTFGQVTVGN
ncbi:MAG: hypothetical protein COY40_02295 [Alphaproteobacteria bacterium CG_4_10_14_0_8_um_filter_53_9]|nr:MAG: hypothetical protein COY40_02295 [Alphaproteobacteria bacterium CG_4_10_14_0_8_um_filter_53_9]